MRRQTEHALLFLLGAALLRIAADDTFLRYVRPGHRWLLLVAGAVMVVLTAVAVARDARPPSGTDALGHAHGVVERHVPWLLLVPVLVLALVAPPALGADAVARAGVTVPAGEGARLAPLPDGPAALPVSEFVQRAVWEPASVAGREVVLVGFAVPRDGGVHLARLSIACCAADARVSRVVLAGAPTGIAPDTWLEVRGAVQPGPAPAARDLVPTLLVRDLRVVPAPSDPYEY